MGTVVRALGCRFQVNSDDHGDPHCHVVGHGSEMKVCLTNFEIFGDTEFRERDAKRLIDIVRQYQEEFLAKWEEIMAKKKKVKFGKTDLLPEAEASPKSIKVRISILIEGDLLHAYKEAAKLTHHGEYQTLMKEKLREGLHLNRDVRQFSDSDLEFLKTRLRPALIEIVDEEIVQRIQPRALKGAKIGQL